MIAILLSSMLKTFKLFIKLGMKIFSIKNNKVVGVDERIDEIFKNF